MTTPDTAPVRCAREGLPAPLVVVIDECGHLASDREFGTQIARELKERK